MRLHPSSLALPSAILHSPVQDGVAQAPGRNATGYKGGLQKQEQLSCKISVLSAPTSRVFCRGMPSVPLPLDIHGVQVRVPVALKPSCCRHRRLGEQHGHSLEDLAAVSER